MLLSQVIAAEGGANIMTFLLPVALIAVFWLLLIRPQRKRQREMAEMQGSIGPGQEVMTGSGMYGTVRSVADDHIMLEIAPGVEIKVVKQAVMRKVEPETPGDDAEGAEGTDATDKADSDSATESASDDVPLTHDDGSRKK